MVADVDVLGVRLCYRVRCHEDGTLVITTNWDSIQLIAKLTEQTSNLGDLVSTIALKAMYSASVDEYAIVFCTREVQLIRPSASFR